MGAEHVTIDRSIEQGIAQQLTPAAIGASLTKRTTVSEALVGLLPSTF